MRTNSWISNSFDEHTDLIDAIQWNSIDASCVVIVASIVEHIIIENYGAAWGVSV